MRQFSGRVAVVTGAASGIGRAIAERLAAEGMRIVLADVEEPALDVAVHELLQQEYDVFGVVTDVTDAAAVERLRDEALDAYGAIHLVCSNAGVTVRSDRPPNEDGEGTRGLRLWEQPLEEFTWLFGVNLWGVVHGIRHIRTGPPRAGGGPPGQHCLGVRPDHRRALRHLHGDEARRRLALGDARPAAGGHPRWACPHSARAP